MTVKSLKSVAPRVVELGPRIRVLQVPDDSPMHPMCTNIYLLGDRELTLVDTGVEDERYSRALFQCLLALGPKHRVTAAALSHSHLDHAGGLRWLTASIGPEVYAHPGTEPVVRPRIGDSKLEFLDEGSVLECDGLKLDVYYTPGHSADSLCLLHRESGLLFTGDTILGQGTTTIQDLGSYMATLERLLALKPKAICPGHGPIVDEPEKVLREYIEHRNMRERQILEELQRGLRSVTQLVNRIYGDIHPRLRRAARGNVRQHLLKLQGEGRIATEGVGERTKYRGVK